MMKRARRSWRCLVVGAAGGCGLGAGVALFAGHPVAAAAVCLAGLAAALLGFLVRPRAEADLAESEERFRRLSDAAFEGIIVHDGGRVLDVNEAFARMSGWTAKELIGSDLLKLLAPESREAARRHIEERWEPPREYTSLRKDGSTAPVEVQARSIVWDGRPARVVAVRDITERRRAQAELRESRDLARALMNASEDLSVLLDERGNILAANETAAARFGRPVEQLIGSSPFDLFPADVAAARQARIEEVFRTGKSIRFEDRREGRDYRQSVYPVRDADGRVRTVAVYSQDVTDIRRQEDDLRRAKEEWERTFDAVPDLIAIIDEDYRITRVNRAMAERLGLEPADVLGRTCHQCVHGTDRPPENCPHAKLLADGLGHTVEILEERLNGQFLVTVAPLFGADGRRIGSVHVARDVTERRRAERALREREELYRRILDTSRDGIVLSDLEGRILLANRAAHERRGGGIAGRMGTDLIVPEDRERVLAGMAGLVETGHMDAIEFLCLKADGSSYPAEINASLVKDAAAQPTGVVAVVRDITERRRAEKALREREELYRRILDTSLDCVVLTDLEGRIRMANRAAVETYGVGLEGLEGFGLIAGGDRDKVMARMPELITRGEVKGVEFLATRADGTAFPAEVNASLVRDAAGEPTGIVGIVRDITTRKRAEEELARTGALLASIRDAQSLYIAGHDPRQVFDAMLDTLLRMTESDHGFLAEVAHDEHGAARRPLTTRVLAWDADSARLAEAMAKKGVYYSTFDNLAGEAVMTGKIAISNDVGGRPGAKVLPDDHPEIRTFMGIPLFFGGDLVGAAGVANRPGGYDERTVEFLRPFTVTLAGLIHAVRVERSERRALDALRESERRLREVMENARLIAVALDAEGRVTFANVFLSELTGWPREELLGRSWFETCVPEDVRAGVKELHDKRLAENDMPAHYENDILTRHGDRRLIAWDNTTLRDAAGRPVGTASFGRDVTQQRELEDQMRQAQKMEAVGRLAGGVAHDFNNMLAPILGWSDLLLQDMSPDDPRRDSLLHVRVAAERARDLTRQLLAFSRKQVLQLRPVRLADVVRGFEKMLRRTIREDIRIRLDLADDSGAVLADIGQVEQVVANLALNAQDAMPKGGDMTVSVANVDLDDLWALRHPGDRPGSYVALVVADTGEGMTPQVREHLFEPFFTTKEVGRGTGLGLASVYGIVRQHGGGVSVESDPGKGSAFRVCLPRVDVPAQSPAGGASLADLPGGTETVLVVEDNEMVRELTCEMLRERGYKVLSRPTPEECIALVEETGERAELLLTDMIMPHVNGRDLYERLVRTMPGLRVVVMSGYADTLVLAEGTSRFGRHFLQKPFTLRALADMVRAALDEKL